ncbi:unnamed protein product [Kuraishia capsulata CBS 1993]|uniref:non-specific serine/threonine protein kinase n=1 Tax=Kuraishia capsulata CBS 1993 TaxID=1382522 RepID=W6MJF9_9ASCO|nr:uncharacterized protein KUCA_T00000533001 [Kuraishia capsulata CBS 1993]CDK24567.1 unnamed protein product [Kuraishia capsulata CBS 1993]
MSYSIQLSQLEPLPRLPNLRFGKTIGHGSFGIVKSASVSGSIVAVKLVNRRMALKQGVTAETFGREAIIQQKCSKHPNVAKYVDCGYDDSWFWLAMEFGANGDLFDKIEPDKGVDEEIAHFYFKQLVSATNYIHSIGVAHRDIKPENILLDKRGNLKLTDFGLATVYKSSKGARRMANTPCGSPPYLAPEVAEGLGYDPEKSDVWSIGIVLFVLLSGQTPWEMAHETDPDFRDYLDSKGTPLTPPWNSFGIGVTSLLRSVLKRGADQRLAVDAILKHHWTAKKNFFENPENGQCKDPYTLTATLLGNLRVSLSDDEFNHITKSTQHSFTSHMAKSQPDVVVVDDEEDGADGFHAVSATQREYTEHDRKRLRLKLHEEDKAMAYAVRDPAVLQFRDGGKLETRQKIEEMLKGPNKMLVQSLTHFLSLLPLGSLLKLIVDSLNKLGLLSDREADAEEWIDNHDNSDVAINIPVNGKDRCNMRMIGFIRVSRAVEGSDLRKVEFCKVRADPLEWRRFFKLVSLMCRDGIYTGEKSQSQDGYD